MDKMSTAIKLSFYANKTSLCFIFFSKPVGEILICSLQSEQVEENICQNMDRIEYDISNKF